MATDYDLLRFTLCSQTAFQPRAHVFCSHPEQPPSWYVDAEEVGQEEQLRLFRMFFEKVELPENS